MGSLGPPAVSKSWSVGVRIRQPSMERKQRRLDGEPDDDERGGDDENRRIDGVGQSRGHVRHVERSRERVEVTHTDQIETRSDGSDEEVAEDGDDGSAAAFG